MDRYEQGRRAGCLRRIVALPRGCGAGDFDRRWQRPWNIHGLVETRQCADRANRGDLLPASEIGADPGDRDLARLWRRLQDLADFPWLHVAGDNWRVQRRASERISARVVGAQHGREPTAYVV